MNNAEEEIDEAVAQVRPWGGFEDLYPSLPPLAALRTFQYSDTWMSRPGADPQISTAITLVKLYLEGNRVSMIQMLL
jgi:hypothetical protein